MQKAPNLCLIYSSVSVNFLPSPCVCSVCVPVYQTIVPANYYKLKPAGAIQENFFWRGRQSLILYNTCESELLMQHGCMGIFEPPGRIKMQNTGRVY